MSTPSTIRFLRWKFAGSRVKNMSECLGIHFGPYASDHFARYLQKKDGSSGFPWLCLSVEFADRTIDLVCENERQTQAWVMGLQSLCPINHTTRTLGKLLWQRCIMKLNYYGLKPLLLDDDL